MAARMPFSFKVSFANPENKGAKTEWEYHPVHSTTKQLRELCIVAGDAIVAGPWIPRLPHHEKFWKEWVDNGVFCFRHLSASKTLVVGLNTREHSREHLPIEARIAASRWCPHQTIHLLR